MKIFYNIYCYKISLDAKFKGYCLIFALIFAFSLGLKAQQIPFFNSYTFHPEFYNPAAMGEGNIAIMHRRQWLGLEANLAPTTYGISADFSRVLPQSMDKVALGLNVISDQAHIFKRTNIDFNFGYSLFKDDKHRFALGLLAGFVSQTTDFEQLLGSNQAEIDPVIFNTNINEVVFNGGPGLFYKFQDGGDHRFMISLALPQIFTSDIDSEIINDKDTTRHAFDNRMHLRGGIQYRVQVNDMLKLEPALLFRAANGTDDSFGKSTIDANLKLWFLDDLFWVNAGYRVNGESLIGGLGLNIGDNLSLQAYYENHSELKSSYDIALVYRIKKQSVLPNNDNGPKIPTPPPTRTPTPVPTPTFVSLENLRSEINTYEENLEQLEKSNEFKKTVKDISNSLEITENTFDQAKQNYIANGLIASRLKEGGGYLRQAKKDLENLIQQMNTPATSHEAIKDSLNKLVNLGGASSRLNKQARNIDKVYDNLNKPVDQLLTRYQTLGDQMQGYSVAKKIDPSISAVFNAKNYPKLQELLQKELDRVPGADDNVSVRVREDNDKLLLTYTLAYKENIAVEEGELKLTNLLLKYIAEKLRQLHGNQVSYEKITVRMQSDLEIAYRTNEIDQLTYQGEFGDNFRFDLIHFDTDLEESKRATFNKKKGEAISQSDLYHLQIYGVGQYLKAKKVGGNLQPRYEITSPHIDFSIPEKLNIEVTIKKN